MKTLRSCAAIVLAVAGTAFAQTAQDLASDGKNTDNVLTYGMGYHQNRYSPLAQINKGNVKRLAPAWTLSLENDYGEQGQPLVHNGVMYVTNVKWTVAIDAATGRQLWRTPVEFPPDMVRVVCCGVSNKGPAIYEGRLFRTTLDAHVVALDMKTGKELWKQKTAEWTEGYSQTVAPLVANGVLITGISGAEFGIRGFLDGWDPATGKKLWRRYTTAGPGEKGHETWEPRESYLNGGASTWITGSYRSRARSRLLGHRQRRRVEPGEPQGRQPVRRCRDRDPAEDGRNRVALPVRAERRIRLGLAVGADPRRRQLRGQEAQGRDADEPQRVPLRDRPHQRAAPVREAVRQGQLGDARGHGDRPPGRVRAVEEAARGRGDRDVAQHTRREELAARRLESQHGAPLRQHESPGDRSTSSPSWHRSSRGCATRACRTATRI